MGEVGRGLMDEILKLKKRIINIGYGTKKIEYVNSETGKIECVKYTGNPKKALDAGASVVPMEVFVGVERVENKNTGFYTMTLIETMEQMFGRWGGLGDLKRTVPKKTEKKKKQKTGNKRMFTKVFSVEIEKVLKKLKDQEAGTLMKFIPLINWDDGLLVNTKTKKPMNYEGLRKYLGCSPQTLNNRLKVLTENNILIKSDEGYKINNKYISRG